MTYSVSAILPFSSRSRVRRIYPWVPSSFNAAPMLSTPSRQAVAGKFPQIMSADRNIALLRVIKMSRQMQRVAGNIAPFNFLVNFSAVVYGFGNGCHGSAVFTKRFYHGKTSGIFDNGARQSLVCLRFNRRINAAVMGNNQHKAKAKATGSVPINEDGNRAKLSFIVAKVEASHLTTKIRKSLMAKAYFS